MDPSAIHPEGDCSGRNLRGLDLRQRNLRGVKFTGADLSGADLTGADATGADFTGARMFGTTIRLAKGLALAGAELHPFFAVRGDERLGEVRYLQASPIPSEAAQPPRSLAVARDNALLWLPQAGDYFHMCAPTGVSHLMIPRQGQVLKTLKVDARNRAWSLGDHTIFYESLDGEAQAGGPDPGMAFPFDRPLRAQRFPVVSSDQGDLFASLPRQTVQYALREADGKAQVKVLRIPKDPDCHHSMVMANRAGTVLVHANPERKSFFIHKLPEDMSLQFAANGQGTPACLAQGEGPNIWYLQTRPLGFGRINTETAKRDFMRACAGAAEAIKEPHALIQGPDRNLWFTDREGCQIGRIALMDGKGEITTYPLGPGNHPEEIICAGNGRLFFTLRDQAVIGSIQAVPVEAAETKAETPCQRADARPEPVIQPVPKAEPELTAPEARVEPAPAPVVAAPVKPAESKTAARVAAPAARPAPRERLAAMRVHVPERALDHILERHAAGSGTSRYRFGAAHSTREGFLKLLADALAEAEIGRELRQWDDRGRQYTPCRRPGTGMAGNKPTDRFYVVTTLRRNPGSSAWEHVLVTAYPAAGS
jgi:streptogramin lyase